MGGVVPATAARLAAIAAGAAVLFGLLMPPSPGRLAGEGSLRLMSREGMVLRQFRTETGGAFAEWVDLRDYPPFLITALLAAEDRRFFLHPGVDAAALTRALVQNVAARRIVSGGSTLTQQLVRLAWRDALPRNRLLRKAAEMFMALRLELTVPKERILECYLNRVPLRGNQEGFPAAAKRLFGRNIRYLTNEELAALVVLARQNALDQNQFERRFGSLWRTLRRGEPGDSAALQAAVFTPPPHTPRRTESKTLHFEAWLRSSNPDLAGDVRTCISANLNEKIHEIVNSELLFLERYDTENAAVLVLDLAASDGDELAAMVGSRNFNHAGEGQVNGCIAVRQAGSTLKPLLYALAMDQKGYLPCTIVDDREQGYPGDEDETYVPRNYDLAYWGPLTVREALGASRNIPAVSMVRAVGVPRFYDFLQQAGFDHLSGGPAAFGPGLALGTGGATLVQLARAYAAIAHNGLARPVLVGRDRGGRAITIGGTKRLMTAKTAWYISSIMADRDIRRRSTPGTRGFLDFPFDVAVKTGTSKDYRDAWTVGFTTRYLVAVWTGNFSGRPMKRVSGAWGSGRIFHQVMRLLADRGRPRFTSPPGFAAVTLCRASGLAAGSSCPAYREVLAPGDVPTAGCPLRHAASESWNPDALPVIASPVQGESFVIDPLLPASRQPVPVRISYRGDDRGAARYAWRIDNGPRRPLRGDTETGVTLPRGRHELMLMEGDRMVESVIFRVE